LYDHGVDFVGTELELVSTQRVRKTEAHGVEIAWVERLIARGGREEGMKVLADASVEVEELAIVGDLDAELLGNVRGCKRANEGNMVSTQVDAKESCPLWEL